MLKNYIRVASRSLKRSRSYSLLNILGLSLGMSGAILIFLFLQFHLGTDRFQPGFKDLYRVVLDLKLDEGTEHEPGSAYALSAALGADYTLVKQAGFVSKIPSVTLATDQNGSVRRFLEKGNAAYADQGYMTMFHFDWLFNNGAASMHEPFMAVVSEKMARKYFGQTNVVGKILRLDNTSDLKIAGVFKDQHLPTDFNFDIYISLPTLKKTEPSGWISEFAWISSRNATFVRLEESADPVRLEKLIAANGNKYYGGNAKYYEHHLQPLADVHFDERYGGQIRPRILWILGGVGFFLVVIACINFVNMATAQALKRAKEIGVRKVLGSTRNQLFWQFMVETALLSVIAGIVSLAFSALLLPLMNQWLKAYTFTIGFLFQPLVLSFWAVVLLVVIVTAGFYPAVIISGFNPITALKNKGGSKLVGGIGVRRSLVTVQLVIAQVLIIGTWVLMLQMKYFRDTDLGFDQHAVISVALPKLSDQHKVNESLRDRLLQYPQISSVSYQYEAPTSAMGFGGSFRYDNRSEWEKFVIRDRFADQYYLQTYQMPLLAGRSFSAKDSVAEFVVNEELMKRLGIVDPQLMLGKQMEDGASGLKGEIVGVVKSFHLKSLQEAIEPCVIFARPELYKEIAIKMKTGDFAVTLVNIEKIWKETYPDEVFSYQFVDEQIERFYEKEEQLTALIRSFAVLAFLICGMGLYGMVSFMVSQKKKEIGVRKVLGASVNHIVYLFGREFSLLVVFAFLIASPVAWYFSVQWLNGFAYRIELNWWIVGLGGVTTLALTCATVGYKVVRAALVNPVDSLVSD